MESQKALSMAEPKQKLSNLKEFLPKQGNKMVYDFATYLSTYLNDKLLPEGFVLGANLALYDLKAGINGFTNQPIRNSLVGYPSMIYDLLKMQIPYIADAIFPADFATEVKIYIASIKTEQEID